MTGVTGHIGANLYPLLLEHGHDVRCLVRNTDAAIPSTIIGDISDELAVDELACGMDIVIHLAAKISISGNHNGEVWETNAIGTRNLSQACLRHRVRKLIHISSIHVYDPVPLDLELDETRPYVSKGTAYDRSKIDAELAVQMCAAEGLDTIILSPTSILGPNDTRPSLLGSAIIDIARGRLPALSPGGYDFVDVRDVARAILSAITNGTSGERYLLSGTWVSIKELARIIGEVNGTDVVQRTLPFGLLKLVTPFSEFAAKITGTEPRLTRESIHALQYSNRKISHARATAELNFTPRPLRETINDTLDYFREMGMI